MTLEQRISAFISLGQQLQKALDSGEKNADLSFAISRAEYKNPYFTAENTKSALQEIIGLLQEKSLHTLIAQTYIQEKPSKRVVLLPEGKTPLDAFPDMLCILITGNILILKPAEKDPLLPRDIIKEVLAIEPQFKNYIAVTENFLSQFDAIIAGETTRSFEIYMQKYPHLIRKQKTSVAVLDGGETQQDLERLGNDIFNFFGLSRRNVSKLYLPDTFDEKRILDAVEKYNSVSLHYKYMNNYEYNKSIYLVARQTHLDNGFLILKEDTNELKSPLAVVYYEKYSDLSQVQNAIEKHKDEIQYIICKLTAFRTRTVQFGESFVPRIEENIETLNFLISL
jgi:hypothetical protein